MAEIKVEEYRCGECNKKFTSEKYLKQHQIQNCYKEVLRLNPGKNVQSSKHVSITSFFQKKNKTASAHTNTASLIPTSASSTGSFKESGSMIPTSSVSSSMDRSDS